MVGGAVESATIGKRRKRYTLQTANIQAFADWAKENLGLPEDKVRYLHHGYGSQLAKLDGSTASPSFLHLSFCVRSLVPLLLPTCLMELRG